MFQSYHYVEFNSGVGDILELRDSNFVERFVFNTKAPNSVPEIVRIYYNKELPIAANIACYYKYSQACWESLNDVSSRCDDDSKFIDQVYPEIQYSKLYLEQIKEKLKLISLIS